MLRTLGLRKVLQAFQLQIISEGQSIMLHGKHKLLYTYKEINANKVLKFSSIQDHVGGGRARHIFIYLCSHADHKNNGLQKK